MGDYMQEYKIKYIGLHNYLKVFPLIAYKAVKRALVEFFFALLVILISFIASYVVIERLW